MAARQLRTRPHASPSPPRPSQETTKKSRPTIPQSEHSRRPQRRPPPDARAEEGGHDVEVERGKGGGVLRERLVAYRLVQRLHVVVQVWVQAELEPAWEGCFDSELFCYSECCVQQWSCRCKVKAELEPARARRAGGTMLLAHGQQARQGKQCGTELDPPMGLAERAKSFHRAKQHQAAWQHQAARITDLRFSRWLRQEV